MIKIVNLQENYDNEKLESIIRKQNSVVCEKDDLKITYVQSIKKRFSYTAYMSVSPGLFHRMMKTGKVYVGWQRCPVYEHINLRRCLNCNGYNHGAKNCKQQLVCAWCSGNHSEANCSKNSLKVCCNCKRANELYNKKYNTNHATFETELCESYKFYKQLAISKINYTYA